MNNTEWIFFDVGGVLLDDSAYEEKRIDELFHTIHIFDNRVSRNQVADALPRASAMVGKLNDNLLGLFITDNKKLYMARNLMAGKRQTMYENRGTVRAEASHVLAELAKNFKIGLIANQPKSTRELLEEAKITDYIDHFKVSDDHGLAKPDVRYFRAVLNETGTVAEKSMIVDDNIERGLLPAKRIGMKTVWYKSTERRDVPMSSIDHVITNLNELLAINEKVSE